MSTSLILLQQVLIMFLLAAVGFLAVSTLLSIVTIPLIVQLSSLLWG